MENASILSYTGNAALGAGVPGGGVGLLGETDLSPVTESLNTLANRINTVKNIEYQQKIKDRDTMFSKFANMEMDLDKALPEHRKLLKEKISEVEKLYLEHPDVLSNPEAYVKMNEALRNFNELNAYAKTNYTTVTTEMAEAAKIADPDDRDRRLKHLQAQRAKLASDPYELYDPYVKPLTMDYSKMFKEVPADKKVLKAGTDFMDTVQEVTDPNKILENYRIDVVEGNDRSVANMYDEFFKGYGLKTPEERMADFDAWNTKIDKANKYLPEGKKIKRIEYNDVTGVPTFNSSFSKDDFNKAAYVGIRFNEGEAKTEFNKQRADAAKTKSEISENQAQAAKYRMDAGSNRIKAKSYAEAQRLLGKKYKAQAVQIEKDSTPGLNWDELPGKITKDTRGSGVSIDRIDWDNIPENTREYLGIEPLTSNNGQKRFVNVFPVKVTGADGKVYPDETINNYYQKAVNDGYKGSMVDYVSAMKEQGIVSAWDYEIVGRERVKKDKKGNPLPGQNPLKLSRSNKLTTTQNQAAGTKNKKVVLDDESQPMDFEND